MYYVEYSKGINNIMKLLLAPPPTIEYMNT